MERYSLLIPMYRSARFINNLRAVIDSHLPSRCEILLSDQHCLDNTIYTLQAEYENNPQVRFFSSSDAINWVENINFLITQSQTNFFRIAPHDDYTSAAQSERLLALLLKNKDAVLATGPVFHEYLDEDKTSFITHAKLDREDELSTIKFFNSLGLFNGAFKGMARKSTIDNHQLFIKPTATTINSERLWLNALRIAGPFLYSKEIMLTKRLYKESTHRQWRHTKEVALDDATTMERYISQLVDDPAIRRELTEHFWQHAYALYLKRSASE
ncbi:glycosyltransferase family A protein [Gilvimarinus sp. 1_MG-2023]|uniref:glycosyltransferase family A protein n=1 Tax=Gilvimarinus sp. 1_MG-2023 TaxID=3062638 RepID=UPI0026E1C5D3|nr:glycosyltransferase family A protein [Gilvimarinus sp. 1_MG-2023]MDO6746265.1 glycosyltransferase family A protein [Gilvimarinus sp. 1_MG-2023]